MLKKRIVAVLLVKDGVVVQSIGFRRYLPVGRPHIAVEYLTDWGIDEIILLDIGARRTQIGPDFNLVKGLSKYCRVPLTVGGGISKLDQIHELMKSGADKIALNHPTISNPDLICDAARVFGNQCVVASIDAKLTPDGYRLYDYLNGATLSITPASHAAQLTSMGVGEIFLNSVDRDGSKQGFDLKLITETADVVTVPLIVCGGAGSPAHFVQVITQTPAHAVAAANFFHFFEHSVTITKAEVCRSAPIRHETSALYNRSELTPAGRLRKLPDETLEAMLFTKIQREVI